MTNGQLSYLILQDQLAREPAHSETSVLLETSLFLDLDFCFLVHCEYCCRVWAVSLH